jgi:hypothetical protein
MRTLLTRITGPRAVLVGLLFVIDSMVLHDYIAMQGENSTGWVSHTQGYLTLSVPDWFPLLGLLAITAAAVIFLQGFPADWRTFFTDDDDGL